MKTIRTLKPGAKATKKYVAMYPDAVAIRFRETADGNRFTTVEIPVAKQKKEGAMLQIRNKQTGEVAALSRDVRENHEQWIHDQLGTNSESELQGFLDACSLDEFAQNAGKEDCAGVFMAVKDADEYLEVERVAFAEQGNGFPQAGAVIVDHAECKAYRVLPDAAPGDGRVETHGPGRPNTTTLRVVAEDYEGHADQDGEVWEY